MSSFSKKAKCQQPTWFNISQVAVEIKMNCYFTSVFKSFSHINFIIKKKKVKTYIHFNLFSAAQEVEVL